MLQPSPARPSPSGVYFAAIFTSHKETDLNLPTHNIYFTLISSDFFETFVKKSMGLCQGLPFQAQFQSCRDLQPMQLTGHLFVTSIFNDLEHPDHR